MRPPEPPKNRRVLIASSHALFGQGLRSLLEERKHARVEIVGMVSSLDEALKALETAEPDLIIVDYDDEKLNREEFLARFVEGEKELRVVLLSLQSAQDAIVYDRRTMAAAQIDDWLQERDFGANEPDGARQPQPAENHADTRRVKMNRRLKKAVHLIIASVITLVVTVALSLSWGHFRVLPEAASAQAVPIDRLFHIEYVLIAFLFSLIVVFMLYSIIVFRRKKGDTSDAEHIEGNSTLEMVWTVAPLITVMFLAYLGGDALAATLAPEPKALRVDVTGRQWTWNFTYPDFGISSTELYLPVNQQAVMRLSSTDVIHSFWVPEFRVKQDALPGGPDFVRDLRITPTKTGEYKVRCAELCGLQHAYMESPVVVVSQAEFDAWVAKESGVSEDPAVRGQQLTAQLGCIACHSVDGAKLVGPSWLGLYGASVTLADGSTITADEAYLSESIQDANAKVVEGYPAGVMPQQFIDPVTGQPISDAQIADIIAYIQSLK
ncbi:MAG: cytochrome c oxidase subunit II [Anaerolineae bacterium UTCFX2]|jgi:cytochrome c oxidase subunit 2|nr:cytochrome c oxidase subunit II [Anaerolineales bacterium]OQY89610.1 MAG: cytochrome c oxidase subunit II [Anaerolineae bacterium UTCFX2]